MRVMAPYAVCEATVHQTSVGLRTPWVRRAPHRERSGIPE